MPPTPVPDSPAEKEAAESAARARLVGCVRRGGALAVNMSSQNVARDRDILRASVRETHLHYLGVSYGTLVGGLYGDLFTSRVGLMVLDSAVGGDGLDDPHVTQQDLDAWATHEARDFDGLFDDYIDDYIDDCESRDADCPLGSDPKAARTKLVGLLDRLERRPMRTGIDSLPGFTQGWAVTALRGALFRPDAWEDLDHALEAALQSGDGGDLSYLAMYEVGREDDGSYSDATFGNNGLPVTCADWPVRSHDTLEPSARVRERHALWHLILGSSRNPCLGWTGNVRDTLLVGAEPATPVIVIGNQGDQVTPIDETEYMARMILRSRLVTVDAAGHGSYGGHNECADDTVDDYLVRGIAPEDGLECEAD